MSPIVEENILLLGLRVRDVVTGFEGVVSSVGFDLYGCIQAVVTPTVDPEGKSRDSKWFDTNRIKILDDKPVMVLPSFVPGAPLAEKRAQHGPEAKPATRF